MDLSDQIPRNWIKAASEGKLKGIGTMHHARSHGAILVKSRSCHNQRHCDGCVDDGLVPPSTTNWRMHHSDRGTQGELNRSSQHLQSRSLVWFPTESWFSSFKNERYHGIRYATHDAMKAASFEYIEVFYNRTRQHSTLGYRSPVQYLEDWMKKQNQENLAAWHSPDGELITKGSSVSWSSHQDVAEVVERLLSDTSITGVVGVGQSPGITGTDLAEGFASYLGHSVSFNSLTPEAFGEMIAPLFGPGAAVGVVAGYQAQASANAIARETSAQRLLGLTPRSIQQWLVEVSA